MIIPEYILAKLVTGLLKKVKEDWEERQDKKTTLLYHIFDQGSGIFKFGKHDLFKEAQKLFITKTGDTRVPEVRLFFDRSRATLPTFHLTMPAERVSSNGLGVDAGNEFIEDVQGGSARQVYRRRFTATYNIVVTSSEADEVLLMYTFLKAMFISAFDSLTLNGLENAKLGGQDLRIDPSLVPNHIFMRGLSLTFEYDEKMPAFFSRKYVTDVIAEGTPSEDC